MPFSPCDLDYFFNSDIKLSALCRDFIDKMLIKAPNKRLTAKVAMQHPFLVNKSTQYRVDKSMDRHYSAKFADTSRSLIANFQKKKTMKRIFQLQIAQSLTLDELADLSRQFKKIDR
jgi:serine/threonine protein kinase